MALRKKGQLGNLNSTLGPWLHSGATNIWFLTFSFSIRPKCNFFLPFVSFLYILLIFLSSRLETILSYILNFLLVRILVYLKSQSHFVIQRFCLLFQLFIILYSLQYISLLDSFGWRLTGSFSSSWTRFGWSLKNTYYFSLLKLFRKMHTHVTVTKAQCYRIYIGNLQTMGKNIFWKTAYKKIC